MRLAWLHADGISLWVVPLLFYAGDGGEPPHLHVERDDCEAKFWLDPVRLERSRGLSRKDINRIQRLVEQNREQLLESWNEFFNG